MALQPYSPKSPDFELDAMVHSVAMFQLQDGSWSSPFPRRPMVGSQVTETALGIRTLTRNLLPGRKQEMKDRILRGTLAVAKDSATQRNMFTSYWDCIGRVKQKKIWPLWPTRSSECRERMEAGHSYQASRVTRTQRVKCCTRYKKPLASDPPSPQSPRA